MKRLFTLGLISIACVADPAPEPCQGAASLCNRRFNEVSALTTHNAMSNHEDGWAAPNQFLPIPRQLADGVRGLMLDIHEHEGQLMLCHGTCHAGSKPLAHGLTEIAAFLATNRREVLTLILESYIDAAPLTAAFTAAGLGESLHRQALNDPWPTLATMIAADRRLVVLTDRGAAPEFGILAIWEHAFDTPFAAESSDDLGCDLGRGDAAHPLFILNHFLTAPLALPQLAETVNFNPFLTERATACAVALGHIPNFVALDFYSLGDGLAAVNALNGL